MLRIYLDTNLLTKIEDFPLLKEKLSIYSDYLNIVYSSAHIDDLSRSSNAELTLKDLNTIKYYSQDQCLAKYWGEDSLRYDTRDPIEFYETSKETSIDIVDTFTYLDQECEKLGIENPLNKLGTKVTFDAPIDQQNNLFSFTRFKRNPTFKSLFDDIAEVFQQSLTSNNLLKVARTQFDEQIPRSAIANIKGNIIDYLNEELPKTVFNKTFDELALDSLNLRGKDKSYSHFDWFITRYNILDLVGYKSDNNSTTSNIVTDAFHAFYAAHCDIFLSQDKRLRDKAKVLYKESAITTLIFSETEFCNFIDQLIFRIQTTTRLADFIRNIHTLNTECFYCNIDTRSVITEYRLETFFAGYFDYVIWVMTDNDTTITVFTKENRTLSNWYYYKELQSLVKVFVELLGPDMNNNVEFTNIEQELAEDKIWAGRMWHFEGLLISLSQDKDLEIVLRLETIKN